MARLNNLIKAIDNYLEKCHDYPKARAIREFNPQNYQEETWDSSHDIIPSPQGYLQRTQEDLQKTVNYTSLEMGAMEDYATCSFIPLNHWLNGGELPTTYSEVQELAITTGVMGYLQGEDGNFIHDDTTKGEFVMAVHNFTGKWGSSEHTYVDLTMPQEDKLISRAIQKTPPLQQDTVLYTYRELPLDLKVGDHGVIKGYGSTSFNPYVIDDIMEGGAWVQREKNRRLKCKVYAPKGTQGVVLGDTTVGHIAWQSEWLLNKNQRYFVHSIDYDKMEAEIVLY